MPIGLEGGPSIPKKEKEKDVSQKIKDILFKHLDKYPKKVDEDEFEEMEERKQEEYSYKESEWEQEVKSFKKGLEELLNTIDTSWIDKKILNDLKLSQTEFRLDLPNFAYFLMKGLLNTIDKSLIDERVSRELETLKGQEKIIVDEFGLQERRYPYAAVVKIIKDLQELKKKK